MYSFIVVISLDKKEPFFFFSQTSVVIKLSSLKISLQIFF